MKLVSIVFYLIVCILQPSTAQTSTMSSTDWKLQQIVQSLVDRENQIKSSIKNIISKVNVTITDLSLDRKLTNVVTALKTVRDSLMVLGTVSSFKNVNATITCNSIALTIANINFDINKALKVVFEANVNASSLFILASNLNAVFVANFFLLSSVQQQNIQSIVTSLYILVDSYNQYGLTLIATTYTFSQIYFELVFNKQNYCSCPTQLSANSTVALLTTDNVTTQIQSSVNTVESEIRNLSSLIIDKIATIETKIANNVSFVFLLKSLHTISNLMKEFSNLTKSDGFNGSMTCDGAAMKVAHLKNKIEVYLQAKLEVEKRATVVWYQLNSLRINFIATSFLLSDAQKQSVKSVIDLITNLLQIYTEYVLTLCASMITFLQLLVDAQTARINSCNCTQSLNRTTTIVMQSKLIVLTNITKRNFYMQ